MLLTESIDIKIDKKNLIFYRRISKSIKIGDTLTIKIENLSKNSHLEVSVSCDYCGIVFTKQYYKYIKQLKIQNKCCCNNRICMSKKRNENNIIKYGVEHTLQLKEVRDSIVKTNLEKYGFDNYTKTNEYKEKSKQTNLEKYGASSYTKTDEFKDRIRQTNLEKYGVEYVLQNKQISQKLKNTTIERYGVDNYAKTDEYKEKSKQTNLEKYGVEFTSQLKEVKDRIKQTNLERYGVEYVLQSDFIKQKIKQTNLEKYGAFNYTSSDHFYKTTIIGNHPNFIRYIENGISLFNCDCGKDHNFEINSDAFFWRENSHLPLCTNCHKIGNSQSIKEQLLFEFIKSIYDSEIIQSYRDNRQEIDIYLPELRLGFEFNGLYWHSDRFKNKNYHSDKTIYFKNNGIRIVHIWEDDWDLKQNIVKSMISYLIGNAKTKIFARKCEVRILNDSNLCNRFLEDNHIQSKVSSVLKIGLFYDDNLVSLMTFDHFEGRKLMPSNEWNLSRFCSILNTSVVGGASKLLNYFIVNYNPLRIVSYADKDWSDGKLYESLNFIKISDGSPDYKYIINRKRLHKSRFRKSRTNISESKLDLLKIYDCGKLKFELIVKK